MSPEQKEEEQARGLFSDALECLAREDYAGAEARLRQAHRLVPERVSVLTNLAAALLRQDRTAEAARYAERAVALDPANADGWLNLAFCHKRAGAPVEALACCERSIAARPQHPDGWSSRGAALLELQRPEEALESCDRAIALQAAHAEAWSNRGLALNTLQRFDEAVESHRHATGLDPRSAQAWTNLAVTLGDLGRHDESLTCYEKAIALGSPPFALGDWLRTKMQVCDWAGFDAACDRTLAAVDAGERAASPFALLAIPSSPAQQRRCAETYIAELFPARASPAPRPSPAARRIRLGYFSRDFRNNALSYLLAGLFEQHHRSRFELFAFSFGPQVIDAMRTRVEAAFEHFLDVSEKTDDQIAQLARNLELDIAVDLKGLSGYARTGIFARRTAPVQVNYMGYPGTMGAPYIDYLIADRVVVPEGELGQYSECVVWLPHTYWASDSKRPIAQRTPSRAEAGLPENAFVFCCFNNPAKITPDALDVWMRLLAAVEGSVLWLLDHNAAATRNLRAEAQARGIAPTRLVFAPQLEPSAHLARHRVADLVLDTFYYNAHTTAADALWAGLPVLTCPGEAFASRVGASLLHALGLPELIAASRGDYERLALSLATEPERLAAIRRKLNENIPTHPLFDTALFARHMEAAYATMHERSLQGLPPQRFTVPDAG
ncbi:MAG TPA: tetratricopeptide repeat protein [Burkholderiales bacterium]|nr:tetratricopeptide repeat protein [Burkholderiales bacterium]